MTWTLKHLHRVNTTLENCGPTLQAITKYLEAKPVISMHGGV